MRLTASPALAGAAAGTPSVRARTTPETRAEPTACKRFIVSLLIPRPGLSLSPCEDTNATSHPPIVNCLVGNARKTFRRHPAAASRPRRHPQEAAHRGAPGV